MARSGTKGRAGQLLRLPKLFRRHVDFPRVDQKIPQVFNDESFDYDIFVRSGSEAQGNFLRSVKCDTASRAVLLPCPIRCWCCVRFFRFVTDKAGGVGRRRRHARQVGVGQAGQAGPDSGCGPSGAEHPGRAGPPRLEP